jgi:aquaporin related protein
MLAAEKHKGTFLAPLGIGFAFFIAEMSGKVATPPIPG